MEGELTADLHYADCKGQETISIYNVVLGILKISRFWTLLRIKRSHRKVYFNILFKTDWLIPSPSPTTSLSTASSALANLQLKQEQELYRCLPSTPTTTKTLRKSSSWFLSSYYWKVTSGSIKFEFYFSSVELLTLLSPLYWWVVQFPVMLEPSYGLAPVSHCSSEESCVKC